MYVYLYVESVLHFVYPHVLYSPYPSYAGILHAFYNSFFNFKLNHYYCHILIVLILYYYFSLCFDTGIFYTLQYLFVLINK